MSQFEIVSLWSVFVGRQARSFVGGFTPGFVNVLSFRVVPLRCPLRTRLASYARPLVCFQRSPRWPMDTLAVQRKGLSHWYYEEDCLPPSILYSAPCITPSIAGAIAATGVGRIGTFAPVAQYLAGEQSRRPHPCHGTRSLLMYTPPGQKPS